MHHAAVTFGVACLPTGSWGLVTWVAIRVTPIRVLMTLLTKSHDPPSGAILTTEKRDSQSKGLRRNRRPKPPPGLAKISGVREYKVEGLGFRVPRG